MYTEKLSISLPTDYVRFIEHYQALHAYKTRSRVIQEALELSRSRELEHAYKESAQKEDTLWEITVLDGLPDETW